MATVDARDYSLSRATVLTEGYKGLLAVNGASVAALLAFIAQVSGKSEPLVRASFVAVVIFTLGLGFALLIPFIRYHHSKVAEDREREKNGRLLPGAETWWKLDDSEPGPARKRPHLSWWVYTAAQYLSVVAFVAGFAYLAYEGHKEAPQLYRAAQKDCK